MQITTNEEGRKIWSTAKWYYKAMLVASPIISLIAITNTNDSAVVLWYLVFAFAGFVTLASIDRIKGTWLLKNWLHKTSYVISLVICSLFALGFVSAIVA